MRWAPLRRLVPFDAYSKLVTAAVMIPPPRPKRKRACLLPSPSVLRPAFRCERDREPEARIYHSLVQSSFGAGRVWRRARLAPGAVIQVFTVPQNALSVGACVGVI